MWSSYQKRLITKTNWAIKVWTEWATSRNRKFLPDEASFNYKIETLSAQLIIFWLCSVLEIHRREVSDIH